MKFKSLSLLVLVSVLISYNATALPLPKEGPAITMMPETFTGQYSFEGIVALSNCSGSIVRLDNAKDSDPALVLTNGHCLETGFPEPNTAVYQVPSTRSFKVLNPKAEVLGRVNATQVIYSTMTKTDMTLYKLRETYAEIKTKFGVSPLTLSAKHPSVGDAIEVISGYWRRGYSCSVEAFAYRLVEGVWTSNDSIRYSRPGCEIIGGTSGSPVVLKGTRTVIGVNNTLNENGEQCTDNNPCEYDANGNMIYGQGYGYGQQTYWIYSCLNAKNEFDLSVAGCQLYH